MDGVIFLHASQGKNTTILLKWSIGTQKRQASQHFSLVTLIALYSEIGLDRLERWSWLRPRTLRVPGARGPSHSDVRITTRTEPHFCNTALSFLVHDLIARAGGTLVQADGGLRARSSLQRVLSTPQSQGVSHSAEAELRGDGGSRSEMSLEGILSP